MSNQINITHNNNLKIDGEIVAGDKITAHGDIVYGNKNSNIQIGFSHQDDQTACIEQLNELRQIILKLRNELENQDIDELAEEATTQGKTIKKTKEIAESMQPGQTADTQQSHSIIEYLKSLGNFIDKAQKFGEKAGELSIKVMHYIEKAEPLLSNIRKLLNF